MLFDRTDYRTILRERFGQRHGRNPAYSLRAFARDLGLSASRLSEILSGRHELSPARAPEVARRLGLGEEEQAFFADLVAQRSARSALSRKQAEERLARRRAATVGDELTLDAFAMIAKWHHFAILELAKLKAFRPSVSWVGTALGLAKDDARQAIARLCRLGFLERAGRRLVVKRPRTRLTSQAPSDAVKDFHRQVLAKAEAALYFRPMAEREFASVIMAFDADRIDEAKAALQRFRQEFAAEFGAKAGKGDAVYALGLQFFGIDELGRR